ncbi:MAG: nucleotidyltransferase domain-containing protein [Nanoarchaeota archaeon]|nr:nucleotidyltransferase domain-containing protein [Nanoarchaeota archaeon]
MIELTINEQEALLILYKDFINFYNANSLSKLLKITQVGTMKILKRLEMKRIIKSKKIGKSIVYKVNLERDFTQRLLAFALSNESQKHERWKDEFKSLNKKKRVILFYGSASRNYAQARDIDILVLLEKQEVSEVNRELKKIQETLPKKIHAIKVTKTDVIKNLKSNDKAMVEIIKTSIVLYGYDEYMEIINGFASF